LAETLAVMPQPDVREPRFPASFFAPRWRGETPLGLLFWQDMWIYGTLINIVTAVIAMLMFSRDAPAALAWLVYMAPVPYNLFLCAALWKSSAVAREPMASAARALGFVWFVVMMII
jgi:hypothetical protein